MRLLIGGGMGMTQEQFEGIRDALTVVFDWPFGWEVDESSLGEDGMGFRASGAMPINNRIVEKIEQVLLDHGFGLGFEKHQILMALFPS